MEGYADSEGDTCEVWAQNPTWCEGSPEDGVFDPPSNYTNAEGIDPSRACCACRARGYDPVFTIVNATTYGAFLDGVFNVKVPGGTSRRKALSPATHTKAVSRAVRSKAQHASFETDSKSLRVSFENAADDPFDLMCWVFNEHTRRFVAW
jgi:hypothetical protein